MDVPMLNEEEFAEIDLLLSRAIRAIKEQSRFQSEGMRNVFIQEQWRPVIEAYRQITGWHGAVEPYELFHHRIANYGPPCSKCKKPLRTPDAKMCAACGEHRSK